MAIKRFSFCWSDELGEAIRELAKEPLTMSLAGDGEIEAVTSAVNQGIDSHLEACYIRERGDSFERGSRKVGKRVICWKLDCVVSPESTRVLVRRLLESEDDEARTLASDICGSMGIELI